MPDEISANAQEIVHGPVSTNRCVVSPQKSNSMFAMNTKTVIAVILVTLGVVVFTYWGLSLTTAEQPVYFLGMHNESTARHFIPPAVGTLALVSGIVLLLLEPKRAIGAGLKIVL
jgi:hypothetical protein